MTVCDWRRIASTSKRQQAKDVASGIGTGQIRCGSLVPRPNYHIRIHSDTLVARRCRPVLRPTITRRNTNQMSGVFKARSATYDGGASDGHASGGCMAASTPPLIIRRNTISLRRHCEHRYRSGADDDDGRRRRLPMLSMSFLPRSPLSISVSRLGAMLWTKAF